MIQKIYSFIQQNQIINSGDSVIAGVSGGADSVCLFLVLKELQKQIRFDLEVVHVEHGIRGEESLKDAEFTKQLCSQYGVVCNVIHVDVLSYAQEHGLGTEEAARILRYKEFVKRAKEINAKIALAHHKEDNAETIVFQMIRGSGLHGMTGIKPVRYDGAVCYIRPLLDVRRCDIEEFLCERKQKFCLDSTNSDTQYDRNRIRHMVLPQLEQINSQAVSHINKTAQKLSVLEDYINIQVKQAVASIVKVEEGSYIVDINKMNDLHEAIKYECLLEILGRVAGKKKDIAEIHVKSLAELSQSQTGRQIDLPYGITARRQYDKLVISKDKKASVDSDGYIICKELLDGIKDSKKEYILNIDNSDEYFVFKVFGFDGDLNKIPVKPYTKWLCYDMIGGRLHLRKRQPGDYIINDSKGHRKKLKELFINEKVPSNIRDEIWLLAAQSEIAVIFGGRIGENYKVSETTKEVLEIQFNGGKYNGFFKGV